MIRHRYLVPLLAAVVLAPLLAACGPAFIDVTLESYKLTLSQNSAPAGQVAFHISNKATDQTHEFVIFKTDLPEDQLPLNSNGDVDENAPGVTHIDEIELGAGMTGDLRVDLPPGSYVVICNISENHHYRQGMHAAFSVH
jgi:uncharacterized cupredoxin-like copper-binding protein